MRTCTRRESDDVHVARVMGKRRKGRQSRSVIVSRTRDGRQLSLLFLSKKRERISKNRYRSDRNEQTNTRADKMNDKAKNALMPIFLARFRSSDTLLA